MTGTQRVQFPIPRAGVASAKHLTTEEEVLGVAATALATVRGWAPGCETAAFTVLLLQSTYQLAGAPEVLSDPPPASRAFAAERQLLCARTGLVGAPTVVATPAARTRAPSAAASSF